MDCGAGRSRRYERKDPIHWFLVLSCLNFNQKPATSNSIMANVDFALLVAGAEERDTHAQLLAFVNGIDAG